MGLIDRENKQQENFKREEKGARKEGDSNSTGQPKEKKKKRTLVLICFSLIVKDAGCFF